jgi:proteasome lid subunit RPN8/RPN11
MEIRVPKDAIGSAHTHPNDRQDDPSPADIQAAKKTNKWVWVVSRDGLYSVSPKGDVQHIYKSSDWMSEKRK